MHLSGMKDANKLLPNGALAIIALLFIVLGINQLAGALRPILGG
ncbi:hypothetical protein IWX75_000275 [Arthrobacter sp. CAN_A6]